MGLWCPVRFAWPLSLIATLFLAFPALAQDEPGYELPTIVVTQPAEPEPAPPRPSASASSAGRYELPADAPAALPEYSERLETTVIQPGTRSGSLTVPTIGEAIAEINQTPGGVEIVPGSAYQESTPASTLKDVLDYVPGVYIEPKWGEDSRISIRGSSLSRNFHLRGIQLYMDGIPINTADGYGDFQEIDPTAYKYVEVYKGANALRFGANSLGGAINFVMPTGYNSELFGVRTDVGSFGTAKVAVTSGAVSGNVDYYVHGTWQEADGYRDHSAGDSTRAVANLGYRITPNVETRFYFNANDIEQEIPGAVTKRVALTAPKTPAQINVINNWQRNVESYRIANKTAIRLAPDTLLELGAFGMDRHLIHPIFLYLDYDYSDYGGFARLFDERQIAGKRNLLIAGVNLHNGETDADLYGIGPGAAKGPLMQSSDQISKNFSAYLENSFYFLDDVALVAGTQYLDASREQVAILNTTSGESNFDLLSPKVGLLWDVEPDWQIFGNISRSAEIPSFGEGGAVIDFDDILAQRATTYEIGTRGSRPDYSWDLSIYRADIRNELQCLGASTAACTVVNADKTVHQGVELGLGYSIVKGIFEKGEEADRIWLNGVYTYNDFFFDDDPIYGNNEIPGAPPHIIRAELLYKHPWGFYAGPTIDWTPEGYYVDNSNTTQTDAYALLGAKLGFERGNWSGYVEARNLTDKNYIAAVDIVAEANPDAALYWPGNGRALFAGLQMKW
ncbi:TonB-dependent receptor family protein [Methyloligella solikamskensis]|uniref:TonB-dependent receptor family protein n=1 Tax=Methyloligella solikamskensis TaxID=1177756 RepID=A0ABW3JC59_9HYPH